MIKSSFTLSAALVLGSSPASLAFSQTPINQTLAGMENRLTCQTRICAYRFEEGRSVATPMMHSPEPYYYDLQSSSDGTWPREEINATGQ